MYSLISYRHQPGELVIELQRRFRSLMLVPHIIGAVLLFVVFAAMFAPFGVLIWCFCIFCYYRFYRVRVFLCYGAGTLRVVYDRDLVFTQWQKQRIFNRVEVPRPVTWVRAWGGTHGFPRTEIPIRQYQTRFPFAGNKNLGIIVLHSGEARMLSLQAVIEGFWVETPYDKAAFEQSEAALVTQQSYMRTVAAKTQKREIKRNIARFDSTKRYAFDRGETPLRRGDEPLAKGEPVAKKQTRQKSYALRHHTMVRVDEDVSADLTRGTLKLVSTTGGFLSACLATLSVLIFYATIITWIIGGFAYIGMQVSHWERIEQHFTPLVEQVFVRLPEEYHEPVGNAVTWYIDASRGGEDQLGAIVVTVVVWSAVLLILIGVGQIVRWPFWKRWTVMMKYRPHYPNEVVISWRNDRTRRRDVLSDTAQLFRIVPATRKTNRLLTGRSWFSNNPGWKQRHQVVLITDEGTFPLPCGSTEEQEQIVEQIIRFCAECT